MKTKVFAYKGKIGIQSDYKAEGLLNDPSQPGQLGFVVEAKHVDISPEAYEALGKVKRSNDCIGDVDVFPSDKGPMFSWMGGALRMIDPATAEGSRSHYPTLMQPYVKDGIEVPQSFIDAVEKKV